MVNPDFSAYCVKLDLYRSCEVASVTSHSCKVTSMTSNGGKVISVTYHRC